MLSKQHREHLRNEGFTEQEIDRLVSDFGVRSLTGKEALSEGYKAWDGEKWQSSSGIEFFFTKDFGQIRADQPIPRKNGNFAKYLTKAGKKAQAWRPGGCLAVTEGFKDAAIATLRGVPVGAIAGVSHYRKALLEGCGYTIIFDSDGWVNPEVFGNLIKAGHHCRGKVLILDRIPSYPKGGLCELYKLGSELDLSKAVKPKVLLLDWPNHWEGLPAGKIARLAKKAVKLATDFLPSDESDAFINRIADQYRAAGLRSRTLQRVKKATLERVQSAEPSDFQGDYNTILKALGKRLSLNEAVKRLELDKQQFSVDEIRSLLEIDCGLGLKSKSKDVFIEIAKKIAKANSYNPIQDYLTGVYDQYKDKVDLLQETATGLATKYLGTVDPTANILLRKTLIGAIARAFDPGCKLDTMTVLVGSQGIRKSTFWRVLASILYFCDDFSDPSNKDHVLKLHETWIVEWSELHGLSKREINHVKAFLACGRDLIRVPYGRSNEWMLRPSAIVGTSNESQFLTDDTGNRRFWVIECHQKINIEAVEQDRDLIWAAAVHCYKAGEPWWADGTLERSLEADCKRFQKQDAWHDLIADYVEPRERVSVAEIFDCVLDTEAKGRSNQSSGRITKILKLEGFISSPNPVRHQYQTPTGRTVSSRQRVWERKPSVEQNILDFPAHTESTVFAVPGVSQAAEPIPSNQSSLTRPRHSPTGFDTAPAHPRANRHTGVPESVLSKTQSENTLQPSGTPGTAKTPLSKGAGNENKFSDDEVIDVDHF